jgi:hypothetical protein
VNRTSRDHARSTSAATRSLDSSALPPTPALTCDLCGWPMQAHEIARAPDGAILGLIVCAQCVEDNLNARTDTARSEVGLVGGSR